jgi:8-amino-7-oxononanoate synthase
VRPFGKCAPAFQRPHLSVHHLVYSLRAGTAVKPVSVPPYRTPRRDIMRKNQLPEFEGQGLSHLKISEWNGREFVSDGRRYIDFASTNYLGFDFDPLMHERGTEYAAKWGSISGWSRLEVDPEIYLGLEARLARLLGCAKVQLSHTITITNFSIIPAIIGKGVIFCDEKVHTVVWEACRLARDHGAQICRFRHQDTEHLEQLLRAHQGATQKLIAVDGVYSISTALSPVAELERLAREYDAWLIVDDAHGFGILGEDPSPDNPYGSRGNGIARRSGSDYSRTFYVSSFGKAFCTYTAFVTIPTAFTLDLRTVSTQYIFSAPPNPYIIGTVDAALDLNERRGDLERRKIRELVSYFVEGLCGLGLTVQNELLQPVVYVEIGSLEELIRASKQLWDRGVVAGLRAYPLVPENACGLRFALSSLHERRHVDAALNILSDARRGA